jgi:hypothetical protein
MMTCKDVSTLVSSCELATAPVLRTIAVWMHLAMCRHCRAFHRQIGAIGRAARRLAAEFEREPAGDFEDRILNQFGH